MISMEELSLSVTSEERRSGESTRDNGEVTKMLEFIAEGGVRTGSYALSRTEVTKGEEHRITFRVTKPSNVLFFRRHEIPGLSPGDILSFFFAIHEGKNTLKRIMYRRKEKGEYVREGWVNFNATLEPVLKSVSMNTGDIVDPFSSFLDFFTDQYTIHATRRLFIRSAALLVGGAALAKYGGDFFSKYLLSSSETSTPIQIPDQREGEGQGQKTEEKIEVGDKNLAEFFVGDFIDACQARRLERVSKEKGFADRVDSEILSKKTINTLYVGIDATRERNLTGEFTNYEKYGIGNADVLMLICFDPQTFKTTQVSIPRDLFSPEVSREYAGEHSKISQITAGVKTEELLKRMVESATGVPVDAVVRTNIDFFQGTPESKYMDGAFDALFPDGIEIDIQEDLFYDSYPLGYGVEKVEFKKGKQKLKGHDVTKFSRCREPAKADFGRNYRQQQVVSAAKRELGKRLVQEFALGQSTTLDVLIRFLDDQINSKRNMSNDVTVLPVLQDVRTKLVEIRSKPIEGMIALASLVNNSKEAVDSLLKGNSSSSFTPNTSNILVETGGELSFKESQKSAPANKQGDFIEYWKPLRRKVKETFSSTQIVEAKNKKDRAEGIRETEEKIKSQDLVINGSSAFVATNNSGERIEANSEKMYEACSLIKVPLAILYIEKAGGLEKIDMQKKDLLIKLLSQSSEHAFKILFEELTNVLGAIDSPLLWEKGSLLFISMCTKRFGSNSKFGFDEQRGTIKMSGNTAIAFLESVMKLPSSERRFVIDALEAKDESNQNWGANFIEAKKGLRQSLSVSEFHKIGLGMDDKKELNSVHEMGGFVDNTGKYVLYVILNEYNRTQTKFSNVDSFSAEALSSAVEVLV